MRNVAASVVIAALVVGTASCSSGNGGTGGSGGSHGHGGTSGSGPTDGPVGDSGPFDAFQLRNLEDINKYRATLSLAPLTLDATLSKFAQAGTLEESMNHIAHANFMAAETAGTLFTPADGFSMNAGENQGDPNGWNPISSNKTTNELDQIDAIQKTMFDEGPGAGEAHGHYENIMNPQFTRVGIGLLEVGDKLYLTNDFSS
jgi:uncharacterized protein YkwD